MTRIADLLAAGRTFSFEFGPPRTDDAARRLDKTLVELEPLKPSFVSVTYGAGGSTRETTREIVEHIHRDTTMTPMPHLTCVGHTHQQVVDIVTGYRDAGLENLLALGGDPLVDAPDAPSDFRYATELIELARGVGDFSIGVAAFPELHPKSTDRAVDRQHLATKLRAADFGITQFFFRAEPYFRMLDELADLGVDTPVIPGVFAFVNIEVARRFSATNGATIPSHIDERMSAVDGKPSEVRKLAVELATDLIQELLDGGAPGIHLYTLNFSTATREIYANLGLTPSGLV
ncbi:MAG: methylenetetrahydrofolate reductase [Actinomycetota bacterium]|jgi:methylenetetrahydrofolate reductase (NADPH)|nr:methylenetetrahydrofolate reductase [Actinomycetota bacterium]